MTGKWGKTCETVCEEWIIKQRFNRERDIYSKYLEKGLQAEEAGITLLTLTQKLGMITKNEEKFENQFMTGTPDLLINETVYDIKSSWDIFTFPMFSDSIPNKNYEWQLQVYMHLTGLKKARLAYVLVDTPEALRYQEARKISYQRGMEGDIDDELEDIINSSMTFSDIPKANRVKIYDIEYDPNKIKKLEARVTECRDYISSICKE